jgi:hypothetical protein
VTRAWRMDWRSRSRPWTEMADLLRRELPDALQMILSPWASCQMRNHRRRLDRHRVALAMSEERQSNLPQPRVALEQRLSIQTRNGLASAHHQTQRDGGGAASGLDPVATKAVHQSTLDACSSCCHNALSRTVPTTPRSDMEPTAILATENQKNRSASTMGGFYPIAANARSFWNWAVA